MLFIDQPLGAGFSHVEKDAGYVTNEEEMAEDLYTFLTQFYVLYPEISQNDIYIFGESYAGKYIPAIAHKIQQEHFMLPLKGIGIGDGLTHPERQFLGYYTFPLSSALVAENTVSVLQMYENLTNQAILLKDWQSADNLWGEYSGILQDQSGDVNMYDIRTHLQYDFSYIDKYLGLPTTKELMHTTGVPFAECDGKAYEALALDVYMSQRQSVIDLLDQTQVRVLLYNAQFDAVIPVATSINGWIREMQWKGQAEYQKSPREIFKAQGTFAGWVQKHDNLVTCIIGDAGHLSPMNEPGRTLVMVENFIEGRW